MHRPGEAGAVGTLVRCIGDAHPLGQCGIDMMVGEARMQHPALEGREVGEVHRHLEMALLAGTPETVGSCQCPVEGLLRSDSHLAFVVEQSHDLVERTVVDRLRDMQPASRAQHPRDLVERTVVLGELRLTFDIDDYTRWRLLEGLDDIGLTLRNEDRIAQFEARREAWRPRTLPVR